MRYFGPVVEWSTKSGGRFDLSLRGLIGLGVATRPLDSGVPFEDNRRRRFRFSRFSHGRPSSGVVRYRDEFFVAEPHIGLFTHVTDWLGVNVGPGYRFTGRELDIGTSLEGANLSIGFRIGPS